MVIKQQHHFTSHHVVFNAAPKFFTLSLFFNWIRVVLYRLREIASAAIARFLVFNLHEYTKTLLSTTHSTNLIFLFLFFFFGYFWSVLKGTDARKMERQRRRMLDYWGYGLYKMSAITDNQCVCMCMRMCAYVMWVCDCFFFSFLNGKS